MGCSGGHYLAVFECGIECLAQSCIAKRLEEALHSARAEQAWANGLVTMRRDEDYWNGLPAQLEFLLQIDPGHTRHGDIENQALGLPDGIGREEVFRRRECLDREAKLPQEVRERLAHGLVVVYN